MEKIIAIFVLLLVATTDSEQEDYPPDPQYDATEFQVNAIYDWMRPFDKQTIKKTFDEWISQHRTLDTSEIIDSFNITFTQFIPEEEIVPISKLKLILIVFNSHVVLSFEGKPKPMQITGNIQFHRAGNYSPCPVTFSFNFELFIGNITIRNKDSFHHRNIKEVFLTNTSIRNANFVQSEFDNTACQQISEDERQFTYKHIVIQAMESVWIKRIKFLKKSIYHPICDKWLYLDNDSHKNKRKYYSRFKSDFYMYPFFLISDHIEIILNGLHTFYHLKILYHSEAETTFQIKSRVRILLNIASLIMMQFRFYTDFFLISGEINNGTMGDLMIEIPRYMQIDEDVDFTEDYNTAPFNMLIENAIGRAFLIIRHDGTAEFANAMREILRPFNVKMFGNSFEIQGQENFSTIPTVFSKIEIEAFQLVNITWSKFDNLKIGIGTLSCKEIWGQADFLYPIRKNGVSSVPISAKVHIKQSTIHISLQYYFNSTQQEQEIRIDDDDLHDADTTIEITSNHYRLPRKDRIAIGKGISQYFVQVMKNQFIDVAKSNFRPVFDICKNSSPSTADRSFNTVIVDYWTNTTTKLSSTLLVQIVIEGSWNFQSTTVQYANGKLSIAGIQLQNVIATFDFEDSEQQITTSLTMRYFSLIINHTDRKVLISVSSNSEYKWDILPNISLPVHDARYMIEKFESTVEFFIGHAIYAKDSIYQAKFRKLTIDNMMQAILEDEPTTHYESLEFATYFVHALDSKKDMRHRLSDEEQVEFSSYNNDTSKKTERRIESLNSTGFPGDGARIRDKIRDSISEEEICFGSGNSQVIIKGNVEIWNPTTQVHVNVPYTINSNRTGDTSENCCNENLRIRIDDNRMEATFRGKITKDIPALDPGDTTLKTKLTLLTSSFLHRNFEKISSNYDFCKSTFAEKPFLKITNTNNIDDSRHHFPMYHIKLYGLHNFKSLRTDAFSFDFDTNFEVKMTNLSARVIWSYYIEEAIPRMPKAVNLHIDNIELCGKIFPKIKRLIFTDKSKVNFSDSEIFRIMEKFGSAIGSIVLKVIQETIQEEYDKILRDY